MQEAYTKDFYCGTSNVELPVPNKSFYPDEYKNSSRLKYYASLFNSVEINSSFYKIPQVKTVERWAREVPDGFRFSMKLWKEITHAKSLSYQVEDVNRFMDLIPAMADRFGCLLVQFPGGLKIEEFTRVENLLEDIRNNNPAVQVAVEFRNEGWYIGEVFELLQNFNVALVEHDMPTCKSLNRFTGKPFRYIRLHGESGDYRGSYSEARLREIAGSARKSVEENETVYCYFNNTIGCAVQNAMSLQMMMQKPL